MTCLGGAGRRGVGGWGDEHPTGPYRQRQPHAKQPQAVPSETRAAFILHHQPPSTEHRRWTCAPKHLPTRCQHNKALHDPHFLPQTVSAGQLVMLTNRCTLLTVDTPRRTPRSSTTENRQQSTTWLASDASNQPADRGESSAQRRAISNLPHARAHNASTPAVHTRTCARDKALPKGLHE